MCSEAKIMCILIFLYCSLHKALFINKAKESHCPPATPVQTQMAKHFFLHGNHNDFINVDALAGQIDHTFPQALLHLHMSLGPVGTLWIGRRNDFQA